MRLPHPIARALTGVVLVGGIGLCVALVQPVFRATWAMTVAATPRTPTLVRVEAPKVERPDVDPIPPVPDPVDPMAEPVPWDALANVPAYQWVFLDAPERGETPVDDLEWAERIARVWAPDAEITRMEFEGVNFHGPPFKYGWFPEARYVAVSPSRAAVSDALGRLLVEPPPSSVVIEVNRTGLGRGGTVRAGLVGGWRPPAGLPPPLRSACTMTQIYDAAEIPPSNGRFTAFGSDFGGCTGFVRVTLGWHEPQAGLGAWLYAVNANPEVYYMWPDDCTRWTREEALARR